MKPEIVVRWWALALRGIVALGLGIVAFAWPERTFAVLVLLFGILLLVDGILALGSVLFDRQARGRIRFYLTLMEGLVGVGGGLVILLLPEVSRLVLIYLVAGWAVITGLLEILAAVRLRRVIRGEWLLAAGGVLSLVFGALVAFQPGIGVVALMWLLGAYACLFGLLLLTLGLKLRKWTPAAAGTSGEGAPPAG